MRAPRLPIPTEYADAIAFTDGPDTFSTPHESKRGLAQKPPPVERKTAKYLTATLSTVARSAKPMIMQGLRHIRMTPRWRMGSESVARVMHIMVLGA
jgi:hypothetical protein